MVKKKSFFSIFIKLLILVLVSSGILLLISNMNTLGKSFYVKHGGQEISTKASNIELKKDSYNIFTCDSGKDKDSAKNFTVKILSNQDKNIDFNFKIDGAEYLYSSGYDVTAGFKINVYDSYFTIYINKDLTMADILALSYPDYAVTDVPKIDLFAKDYFIIYVTSYDGANTVQIGFH